MAEPISLAEAKSQLRVDGGTDDTLITDKIVASREWVEDYTGLVLPRREVTESVSSFADRTKLRSWPVAAELPIAVSYRDNDGAEQTIAGAVIRATSRPAILYPAAGTRWPLARTVSGAIDVTMTAGFATAAEIPQALKQAMLIMLTAYYEDREGGEMFTKAEESAKSICRRHKRRSL